MQQANLIDCMHDKKGSMLYEEEPWMDIAHAMKSFIYLQQGMSKMLCILFRNQRGQLKALTIKNNN